MLRARRRRSAVGAGEVVDHEVAERVDLAARTELDPELIAAMREPGVLYDRDTHGEVVERRGGYDGYGAANSPVRMAAQREPSRS
jgi:4-hydroxyphenylpyruvate dioxygenase-like putative hemolysin